jgi:hypothetical protein
MGDALSCPSDVDYHIPRRNNVRWLFRLVLDRFRLASARIFQRLKPSPETSPMLLSLALPIVLTAVAVFFASFLSWMVLQLHKPDWAKLPNEDAVMAALGAGNVPRGGYMFPMPADHKEMATPEFQAKYAKGPRGQIHLQPPVKMGGNLVLTFAYFLAVSFCLAIVGGMAFPAGETPTFSDVFRLFFQAGILAYLAAIVQHAIWFPMRIVGHVIESIAYAVITGLIFAALWPK